MTDAVPAAPSWPAMSLAQAHALMTQPGAVFEIEEVQIRGVPTRVWKNGPKTFRDLFLAARAYGPGREFLVLEDDRADFAGFARATLTLAHALDGAGVRKGDRVAVIMRNLPEWPVAFFAATLLGAIVVPMNAWWTGPELHYGLTDSGAKVAVVDSERLQRLFQHLPECPELERVFVAREFEPIAHPYVTKLESVIGGIGDWGALPDLPLPDVVLEPEDDAAIFYTSGTTGKPKGALLTHRNGVSDVLSSLVPDVRATLRRGEVPQPFDPAGPQRRVLLTIPFFHVTGCFAVLFPSLFLGALLVLMRKWDAEAGFQLIEHERITLAGGVPAIAWQLVEHPARGKYDLSSLEGISYGGAPAPAELVRRIRAEFPRSQPGNGWGMTETTAIHTQHKGEDYEHRPDSCGPAIPVCDIKVVGADGQDLPVGEVGELWAKGPNIAKGYWNKPEATVQTFVDGWVKTGDLAKIDAEGFCFIVDRAKDMVIRGGENIYSAEVEAVLHEHPAVMDAALVGVPHKTLGEEPVAAVTLKPETDASEDDLRAFVAERLAAFKVPVRILIRREPLPRNANGKVLKAEVKAWFV